MKRRDEVSVGILISVATAVLILGTLYLVRGGLKSGYPLYTRFGWGQNLKQGQPVLLAGVTVGYVGDVNLRPEGYLDVLLRVDDKYKVPKGSKATVKAIGIFGDVAVALVPPIPPPPVSYAPGDTVPPGPVAADVDQIMSRVDSIGQSASLLMRSIQAQIVDAGTLNELHKTIASTARLSAQLQGVLAEQNRNATRTMEAFRASAERVGGVIDSQEVAATLANIRKTSANFARLTDSLESTKRRVDALIDQTRAGPGTIGKFMSDSMLYSDTRKLLVGFDSLIADIKANPKKYINVCVFRC